MSRPGASDGREVGPGSGTSVRGTLVCGTLVGGTSVCGTPVGGTLVCGWIGRVPVEGSCSIVSTGPRVGGTKLFAGRLLMAGIVGGIDGDVVRSESMLCRPEFGFAGVLPSNGARP